MIVLFLTGVVAMIMLRTLHKDIANYNEMQTIEEAQEESGWKLVHGDVFRPPAFSPMLLSVLAGMSYGLAYSGVVMIYCRCWRAVACDDHRNSRVYFARVAVSREPRWAPYSASADLCIHGVFLWLCFCAHI